MPLSQNSLSWPKAARNLWVQRRPKRTLHLSRYVGRCSRGKFTSAESPGLEAADEESTPDRIEEDHASRPRKLRFKISGQRMSLILFAEDCYPAEARSSETNPRSSSNAGFFANFFTNWSSTTGTCPRSRIRHSQWIHFSRNLPHPAPGRGFRQHEIVHDGSLDSAIPLDCCRC